MTPDCATCVASCCRLPLRVGVTADDVERLGALAEHVIYGEHLGPEWVGELRKVGGNCVFLSGSRCSIYDRRPWGCREYLVETCRIYATR